MSSSRSTSPKQLANSVMRRTESSGSGGGGGGTLSNDALYAPLSTYDHDGSTSTSKKKGKGSAQQHSLSLQTSSSLRESTLITFLSNISSSTTHDAHNELYKGMGRGSMSMFGGDGGSSNNNNSATRNLLESKLSNRSLILVGGGVHKVSASNSKGSSGYGGDTSKSESLVSASQKAAATSTGKRVRKRVGGNGIFGSISNKKRKRLLQRIALEKRQQVPKKDEKIGKDCELQIHNESEQKQVSPTLKKNDEPQQKCKTDVKSSERRSKNATTMSGQVGSIIETLNNMWLNYIHQLLLPIKQQYNVTTTVSESSTADTSSSLSLSLSCKQISHLVATGEHVGMAATIIECPSRRHLVNVRCIIVNETKETYQVATIKKSKTRQQLQQQKQSKKNNDKKHNIECEGKLKGGHSSSNQKEKQSHHINWKIVLVPKRGTILHIDIPWNTAADGSSLDGVVSQQRMITVRLET